MSKIKEKLSKIFAAQIPEFIRVGDTDSVFSVIITTVINTKKVTVDDSTNILVGDKLVHPAITNQVYVTNIVSPTEITVSNNIAVSLTRRVAKFERDISLSNFAKFLEAYYKFLEQDQYPQELLQNARKYGDIDLTIDTLIEEFFKTYANDIPRNVVVDKPVLLKHVKDIYSTKGSEEAYRLLFRAMFNSDVEIFFPNSVVLKTSDGKWYKNKSMFIHRTLTGDPYDFINTKIVGANSNASAIVENVVQLKFENSSIYELTLSDVNGTFIKEKIVAQKLISPPSNYNTITANSAVVLTRINIVDGSNGYSVNDDFVVFGANAKITGVSETGKIEKIKILRPYIYPEDIVQGNSYVPNFNDNTLQIVINAPSVQLDGNVIISNGVGTFISENKHGLVKGETANILSYGNAASYLNSTENVITVSTVLDTNTFRFMPSAGSANTRINTKLKYTKRANIQSVTGIIFESEGNWVDNSGKLSELVYIQGASLNNTDSSKIYYQPYSYVVRSDVSVDKWYNTATELLHPAGTEIFGEILINNKITANAGVTGSSEIWDYLGLTADSNTAPFLSSMTTYTNRLVANLAIKADTVSVIFGYL
jgi:hypothetical protein